LKQGILSRTHKAFPTVQPSSATNLPLLMILYLGNINLSSHCKRHCSLWAAVWDTAIQSIGSDPNWVTNCYCCQL